MPTLIADRISYILDECRGKSVLHLGCTDWPYLDRRLSDGVLLHARIGNVAASLVGVDADQDGVECLVKLGYPETYVDNVESFSNTKVGTRRFDVIVAGEIVEHLENPGMFLRSVQKLMTDQTVLIVTTVNAYCFHRFFYYLFSNELVHEDHNYYFSPKVLRRLLTRCGLEVVDFRHYAVGREIRALNPRRLIFLDDLGRKLFPRASDGVIFKARLPGAGS